jgi:hypothetical protein
MVKKEKPPLSSLWAAKFFDFSWSGSVFFQGRDQAIIRLIPSCSLVFVDLDVLVLFSGSLDFLVFQLDLDVGFVLRIFWTSLVFQLRYWNPFSFSVQILDNPFDDTKMHSTHGLLKPLSIKRNVFSTNGVSPEDIEK